MFNTLGGDGLIPKRMYALYNPVLVMAFISMKKKLEERAETSPELFFLERWLNDNADPEKKKHRQCTRDTYANRTRLFSWNEEILSHVSRCKLPILATVHGTSLSSAWKICNNGFASLSLVDCGFYGVGMYFTTYAKYSLPYFVSTSQPAIIISYVIPGKFFLFFSFTLIAFVAFSAFHF